MHSLSLLHTAIESIDTKTAGANVLWSLKFMRRRKQFKPLYSIVQTKIDEMEAIKTQEKLARQARRKQRLDPQPKSDQSSESSDSVIFIED